MVEMGYSIKKFLIVGIVSMGKRHFSTIGKYYQYQIGKKQVQNHKPS